MQHDKDLETILNKRMAPPSSHDLSARIIDETSRMPQSGSYWQRFMQLISTYPTRAALASVVAVMLVIAVLPDNDRTLSPAQIAQTSTGERMFAASEISDEQRALNSTPYAEFQMTFEQETLTFMLADLGN